MNFLSNNIRLQFDEKSKPEFIISTNMRTDNALTEVMKLREIITQGKTLDVEIEQHREKRSLDANAYLWVLLSKIAEAIKSSKDEVYLQMLERYGQFTHIIVLPKAVEKIKKEWRTVRELGEVTVNGKKGVQLQCYYGSSTYNSKEFNTLLSGVVDEAKELDIETATPEEQARMISEWGRKD